MLWRAWVPILNRLRPGSSAQLPHCRCLILGLLGLWAAAPLAAGAIFVDATQSAGLTVIHNSTDPTFVGSMSGGAAVGDYDNDGWPDLYVTRIDAPDILYRNLGNGQFADVTKETFQDPLVIRKSNGPAWGDIDNDGDLDLYVTSWGGRQNALFINDHGFFHEDAIARNAAVEPGTRRTAASATWGDYDGDGYLDLYTTEWQDRPSQLNHTRLLHNLGAQRPGYFEDVTQAAGVAVSPSFTFAPRFSDLDRDGHVDLAIAADYHHSTLLWNQGNGTFRDGTQAAHTNEDGSAMGSSIADYDNDGDLDWFVANADIDKNNLYQNQLAQGQPRTFVDVAEPSQILDSDWSWGSSFLDFDNDGNLDVFVTNGVPYEERTNYAKDPVYLFRSNGVNASGNVTFSDVSDAVITNRDRNIGSGLVVFDYDRDGDQDVFVVNGGKLQPSVLYRNDGGNASAFLQVELAGTRSNRAAIGAWITVTPDLQDPATVRVWEVNAGSNFLGQNEATAHWGWGNRTDPLDRVTIDWPSGQHQEFYHVPVNSRLVAVEPVPEPHFPALLLLASALLGRRLRCWPVV